MYSPVCQPVRLWNKRHLSPRLYPERKYKPIVHQRRYNDEVPLLSEDVSTEAVPSVARHTRAVLVWFLLGAMLAAVVLFFALHLLHLRADFPNHSRWTDWAKYTDEGWYGDAAIRHYLRGTWHLPGDFNPAAALPVWPLLEAVVFRFTGVGIVAARTLSVFVFGGILLCAFVLLRLGRPRGASTTLCAAAALLLMAVSPYFYVFSRMAVLEPLLVLLTLVALLTAWQVGRVHRDWQKTLLQIGIGVLIALMVGTKTTAIALVPAIAYLLASAGGWRRIALLRSALVTGGAALLVGGAYYLSVIRQHYLQDFRYLFSANQYTGITAENAVQTIADAFRDGAWMGNVIYVCFFVALAFVLLRVLLLRRAGHDPVLVSLLLWIAGYFAFLVYHANLQPRYYFVIAVPVTLVVARAAQQMLDLEPRSAVALLPALCLLAAADARQTLHFVRNPEYTFQNAAVQVGRIVESEPQHSHTVLSISGSDLSLMTGLPSICDDFGTMDLEDRIAAYKPGWFVAWNYVEDDKMDALAKFYRLTRVAAIPAMDDPDRNLMIVYRLDPKQGVEPKRRSRQTRRELKG